MKNTAVVILNYNGIHFLKKFLRNTVLHSQSADVYVIDNGSTDDSVAYLNTHFPQVNLILLEKNYGFAEGYNRGLAQLEHRNFVLLNSDVEVAPGWLEPLESLSNLRPDLVALQPKILDYSNRNKFEYAGAAGGHLDALGYPFCRGRIFETIEIDNGQYDDSKEIFWASGACLFIRASVFKTLGGFDARFFAHMEEIDLCWRMQNCGLKIAYVPTSVVYHVGGGTLAVENSFKTYLNYRNNLAMLFKNLPSPVLLPLLLFKMLLDGISALRFIMLGQPKNFFAVIKAHLVFYTWIPYLLRHRNATFLGFNKLHRHSIVWQYFVKGKKTFS